MTRERAIEKIMSDLGLHPQCEDYVLQMMGRLGCEDSVDVETIAAIEIVIKRDLSR